MSQVHVSRGLSYAFIVSAAVSSWAQADEQAEFEERQSTGYLHVVELKGLIDDYQGGTITEADFVAELWQDTRSCPRPCTPTGARW